jgi:hypothetical protein
MSILSEVEPVVAVLVAVVALHQKAKQLRKSVNIDIG